MLNDVSYGNNALLLYSLDMYRQHQSYNAFKCYMFGKLTTVKKKIRSYYSVTSTVTERAMTYETLQS